MSEINSYNLQPLKEDQRPQMTEASNPDAGSTVDTIYTTEQNNENIELITLADEEKSTTTSNNKIKKRRKLDFRGRKGKRDSVGLFVRDTPDGTNALHADAVDSNDEIEFVGEVFVHETNKTNCDGNDNIIDGEIPYVDLEDPSVQVTQDTHASTTTIPIDTDTTIDSTNNVSSNDIEVLEVGETQLETRSETNTRQDANDIHHFTIHLPGGRNMHVYDPTYQGIDRASFESQLLFDYQGDRIPANITPASNNSNRDPAYLEFRRRRRFDRQRQRNISNMNHVALRATASVYNPITVNNGIGTIPITNGTDDDHDDVQVTSTRHIPGETQSVSTENLPLDVRRMRSELETRRRMELMQERQRRQEQSTMSVIEDTETTREFNELKIMLERYPEGLRALFETCESLNMFTNKMKDYIPAAATGTISKLQNLYIRYRSFKGRFRITAYQREQERRNNSINGRSGIVGRNAERGRNGAQTNVRSGAIGYDEDSMEYGMLYRMRMNMTRLLFGRDVLPPFRMFSSSNGEGISSRFLNNEPGGGGDDDDDDESDGYGFRRSESGFFGGRSEEEETQNIINMIQRREERERDHQRSRFENATKHFKEQILKKAREVPIGYSCSFDTKPQLVVEKVIPNTKCDNGDATAQGFSVEKVLVIDEDSVSNNLVEVPICVLCGAEFGKGIPDDFKGKRLTDVSFEHLVDEYEVPCPYQTLSKPTQIDRVTSRRCFVATCGHTYCGRCVLRIQHAKNLSAPKKRSMHRFKGPSNPNIYGPKRCVAENCKIHLHKKGVFQEMFL